MSGVRMLVSCLVGFALSAMFVTALSAHSGLLVAVPAPGDEVGGTVDQLQLYFGEEVESVVVRVLDPEGNDIAGEQNQPIVGLIEVSVATLQEEGVYVISYAVSYEDGAAFDSVYQFTYRADAAEPLALEFDGVEPESDLLSRLALGILVASSLVLLLLLAWRFRQMQAERAAAEE